MSKAHYLVPTGPTGDVATVRLGAGTGASNQMSIADQGKLVKLVGDSRYDLCAAGDAIEGVILSVELASSGGYSIGSIVTEPEYIFATADGLQATAGTGVIAVGDYVVAGTITAKATPLVAYPKVTKATVQPGAVPNSLTEASAQTLAGLHAWRVVSLYTAGTGAVGTTIVLEPIN